MIAVTAETGWIAVRSTTGWTGSTDLASTGTAAACCCWAAAWGSAASGAFVSWVASGNRVRPSPPSRRGLK